MPDPFWARARPNKRSGSDAPCSLASSASLGCSSSCSSSSGLARIGEVSCARHGAARESLGHHRSSAGRQNQGRPTYHGFARTDEAARCLSVGKSMMSPPPKHALNRFSYPFLSSRRNPPFGGAKNYRKNYRKALTLRRHSDRHVRVCFPHLQREIQRSVRLLATE
jgi:hypothetical protein